MVQVTVEEAKDQLQNLIAEAINGETIVITQDGQQAVQLVPTSVANGSKQPRKPGSAKGMIQMSEDFDAPLEDFKE
jgi:antitoxin (DNA-binding transcriptional repressor) of toxin-antitoxin stability system